METTSLLIADGLQEQYKQEIQESQKNQQQNIEVLLKGNSLIQLNMKQE